MEEYFSKRPDTLYLLNTVGLQSTMAQVSRYIKSTIYQSWDIWFVTDMYELLIANYGMSWHVLMWSTNRFTCILIVEVEHLGQFFDISFIGHFNYIAKQYEYEQYHTYRTDTT